MSRILRRPMFRGGRVDSRGTGITSGLDEGYADGGRVGFQRGGYSTIPGIDDLSQIGIYNPYTPLSSFAGPGPQYITPRQRRGLPPVSTIPSYYTGTARQQMQQRQEDLRTQAQAEEEDIYRSKFALANPPISKNTETETGAGAGAGKGDIDLLDVDEKEITKQTKLYEKLLGGEEARSQAAYDALLAAAPAFFKGRNLREAAPQVLESINKSGAFDKPRDIKQAAAQLAIQRRILMDKASAEENQRLALARIAAESREKGFTEELKQIKEITGRGAIDDEISFDFSNLRSNEFYQQIQKYKDGNQISVVNPKTGQRLYLKIKSTDPKNPNAPKGFERIGGNI